MSVGIKSLPGQMTYFNLVTVSSITRIRSKIICSMIQVYNIFSNGVLSSSCGWLSKNSGKNLQCLGWLRSLVTSILMTNNANKDNPYLALALKAHMYVRKPPQQ